MSFAYNEARREVVTRVLGRVAIPVAFLQRLSADGGLGGGQTKQEIFPGIYDQDGKWKEQIRNPGPAVKRNDPNGCFTALSDLRVSLVESPDKPLLALSQDLRFGPNADKTIALLAYCWQNPGELDWKYGTAVAVSGKSEGGLPDLPGIYPGKLQLDFDPMIVARNGETKGLTDAERKVLTWALNVTSTFTIGWADLYHIGPKPQCTQCGNAVESFRRERPLINLNAPSNWFQRSPYGWRG